MARLTLRLPEDLHRRLRSAAERSGTSLNTVIVEALNEAIARGEGEDRADLTLREQVQQVRRALGDLVVDVDASQFPPHLRPAANLPNTDTLRQTMPRLAPPLSSTIIAERDDRV